MTDIMYLTRVRTAARALSLGEQANWELAQQTYETTFEPRTVTLEKWCADVREVAGRPFSIGTGRLFRKVWQARLALTAAGEPVPSFSDLQREVSPSSHDPEVVHARQAASYLQKGTPEQKASAVATLLDDPDVRRKIADLKEPVSQAFGNASLARDQALLVQHREARERMAEREAADPVSRQIDAADALNDLEEAMDAFVHRVAAAIPRVTGLPDPATDPWARAVFLRQLVARSRGALEQIESLLNTGTPTGEIDHFLRDVLASGKEGA
jgi:hypothetical protein